MKMLTILTLTLAMTFAAFAQNKTDAYSKTVIRNFSEAISLDNGDGKKDLPSMLVKEEGIYHIKCLIKVKGSSLEDHIIKNGGKIIVKAGDIWGIKIPFDKLDGLLKEPVLERLSVSKKMKLQNFEAAKSVMIDSVHAGKAGGVVLKGEGVIVGVCDTGIDYMHPDFVKDNRTRINYIWDMSETTYYNPPGGYTVGAEYDAEDIEQGVCYEEDVYGHGTHVTATAAGNGNGNPKYTGMAPKADIISAKISYDKESKEFASDIDIISATEWMFSKADEAGKPIVINMSFGWMFGPHDGTGLLSQGLSNLTGPGKIIVASAGNSGQFPMHTGIDYQADEYYETVVLTYSNLCRMMRNVCPDNMRYFATGSELWYSENTIDSIFVTAYGKVKDRNTYEPIASRSYAVGDSVYKDSVKIDTSYAFINLDAIKYDNKYNVENILVLIHNNGTKDRSHIGETLWGIRVKTKDSGRIDSWSFISANEGQIADIVVNDLKVNMLGSNSDMMVSTPADAEEVISVGSYTSLNTFTNADGNIMNFGITPGEISLFSSGGPSRTGEIKPAVTAPGEFVISALSGDKEYSNPDMQLSEHYIANRGTSMSAPVVSGTIALMLQVKPDLTRDEIVEIFRQNAVEDEFTGNLPNNAYGFGKLNALAAIKSLVGLNVKENSQISEKVELYPNPANDILRVDNYTPVMEFVLFDAVGNALEVMNAKGSIDVSSLSSGKYFLNVREGMTSYAVPFTVKR